MKVIKLATSNQVTSVPTLYGMLHEGTEDPDLEDVVTNQTKQCNYNAKLQLLWGNDRKNNGSRKVRAIERLDRSYAMIYKKNKTIHMVLITYSFIHIFLYSIHSIYQ